MTDRDLAGCALLPCPFCGAAMLTNHNGALFVHPDPEGSLCPARYMEGYSDDDKAAWNRRAPSRDAVRLDWLETYAHCADWDDYQPLKRIVRGDDGDEFCADTWRAAIDAAIAAAEGENHG